MAVTRTIRVHDANVHPETGHITYTVSTESAEGSAVWHGPAKQYGCDPQTFHDRFNNDVSQLENWIKTEHQRFMGAHPDHVAAVEGRKGQAIG
jgi:hypothetical protein